MKNLHEKIAMIIGGGDTDLGQVSTVLFDYKPDLLIAADSGLEVFDRLHIIPDYIIGDFDSLSDKSLLEKYRKLSREIRHLPCEKDYTDMKMACDLSMEKGAKSIILLGAVGTRLDHTLGNVLMLRYLNDAGVQGVIVDSCNRISCVGEGIRNFSKKDSRASYISFLPVFEPGAIISLHGFKYDVEDFELNVPDVTTISNELEKETCQLIVKKGSLLVVESSDIGFSLH